jgi:hypothetical protein
MDSNVDESLIEATIRRVAEAQAARDGAGASETLPEQAGTPTAAIREAAGFTDTTDPAPPGARDDVPDPKVRIQPAASAIANETEIEATIRRVAAATAKRVPPTAAPDPDAPEEGTQLASAREPEPPLTFAQRGHGAAALAFDPVAEPEASAAALARIEQSLDTVHVLLRQIIERLDSTGDAAGTTRPALVSPVLNNLQDDEWEDEAPPLQSMAFGGPLRPSILRDPPARAAEQPAMAMADEMDNRPLPAPLPPLQPDTRRGFDLLPRTYRITVEDKRRGVDLVPLHRALLAMDGVRDMSLLSYNNGVAIVSLETVSDIDTDVLARAVSRAMSRAATVETHNERTLVVKLAED